MYFPPRIALVCATVVLISCKSNETDSAVDVLRETSAENQEKWFCQMAEDNPDAWDCVQDDVLAENPIPDRIPEGTLEKEQNDPASIPVQNETRGYPKGLRPSEDGLPSPPDQILNTPNPNASPPLHEQLSYRPDQDRNLEDLPSDFYTIQLLALSNKRALEEFAASTKIKGYSAAEVEKDGSFFYVLLLGVYADKATAEKVAQNLPRSLGDVTPWVRPLGSLQDAMLRAKLQTE